MNISRFNRLVGFLALSLLFSGSLSAADVAVDPELKSGGEDLDTWRQEQASSFKVLRESVGALPHTPGVLLELTAEDRRQIARSNTEADPGTPYRVGVVQHVALDVGFGTLRAAALTDDLKPFSGGFVRRTQTGGVVWAMRLETGNTGGARLHLKNLSLPEGASLTLYNENGDVRGPYKGVVESLWTHSIEGDAIFLQMEHPRARDPGIRSIGFRIEEALLLDSQALAFCPINASCVEDGSCYDTSDWAMLEVARKAIANMLFIQGGSGYICTGGLLNDTDTATQIPYFLTANHCISTQAVASTVETRFNYQTAACGGACVWPNTPTTLGATLLHTSATDDHTLLRLSQDPLAGAAFLGWSTNPIANASDSALYRLSHPKGSPQAYSTHAVSTTAGTCRGLPRGAFIYSRDQVGAIEGGSSGSPVMNQQAQVVGQLFGKCGTNLGDVCDAASNATVDGAFANYFSQVAEWLDPGSDPEPCPSEVLVADHSGASTWLGLLRGVRDRVLPTLSDGAWMRERYYRHAAEVTRLLAGDRRLRADALALLRDLRPALETAVAGGDLALNRREQGAMIGFVTALQASASPDLADDLNRFLAISRP